MLNGKTKHKTSENSIHLNKTKQNKKNIFMNKKTTHTKIEYEIESKVEI